MRRFDDHLLLSPSDLNDLLECRHLMTLEIARFRGDTSIPKPTRGAHTDILVRYGEQHEQQVLADIEASGTPVVRIETGRGQERLRQAVEQTRAAMADGAEVIHQAALVADGVGGYADFLERVERPSWLGDWSYEVADAKLARTTKPYFLVQLSAYAAMLEELQGIAPEDITVLLGDGSRDAYRTADFAAYVRRLRDRAGRLVADGTGDTYPLPCSHCAICGYRHACEVRREADDHLSLVAGLGRDQAVKLEEAGITTLAALAGLSDSTKVPRLARDTLAKLRAQAALQLEERVTEEQRYELLPYVPERGFGLLPPPDDGDPVFDIEGDPYIGDKGLEYLFGVGWREHDGGFGYRAFWAHDRDEERRSFEELIDFFVAWRAEHPDSHIYHYAAYEEQALKTLAMYHATREDEVDDLLRAGALVDLYRVVRQGVRISKPSYSLKQVEHFYPFERDATVKEAGGSIVAYERWIINQEQSALAEIEAYNREDCASTLGLRDWLLELRDELVAGGVPVEWRPPPEEPEEQRERMDDETRALRERLQTTGDPANALLGELLLYHRREAKPAWWWYFERLKMTDEELRDEDGEAIGDLERDGPPVKVKQSQLVPMRFDEQQQKLAAGDNVVDPRGQRSVKITQLDAEEGTLTLKLGIKTWQGEVPRSLIPGGPYFTNEQRAALRRIAGSVLDGRDAFPAALALLRRELPRITGVPHGTTLMSHYDVEHAVRLATSLDRSVLPIQGPPGTGKTYSGARVAVELVRQGRRVGISAPSRKAIHNLLHEIERLAHEQGVRFQGLKSGKDENAFVSRLSDGGMIETTDSQSCDDAADDILLVAGTSWLFSREGMQGSVDTLLIDEAGQVSLADALVMATSARNVVLLGDPQQLPQVSQGGHPEETKVSALEHILGEQRTMPHDRGLFIDRSRRMHPDVCRFVSEISYAGELESLPECANQRVISDGLSGAGLRAFLTRHAGNRRDSPEEAEVIADQVARLTGGTMITAAGDEQPIERAGVMVVTPYNAQARRIRKLLDERGHNWVDVGTVDKFQGREAAVVFFSMATSSGEDVPRNVEFLLSRNRLNVAISRARCLAVLVASPELLAIRCRTAEQMRLANALCRFAETAS